MKPHYPPIDFPLYGLDASWRGTRWLTFVQGTSGEPIYEVTLGHGDRSVPIRGHPLLHITTRSATHAHDRDAVAFEGELAWRGLFTLTNMTSPGTEIDLDRSHMSREVLAYVRHRAERRSVWARATWSVDGVPVPARYTRFAGAWTGFASVLDGIGLSVIGYRFDPRDLAIARIASGAPYGFDLDAPVVFPDTLYEAQATLGDDHWIEGPSRIHTDWRKFISDDD